MDTDQCIQRLIRMEPEGSDCAQWKIEDTTQYWVMKEKEAVTNYCHTLGLNKSVSDKRVQQLYSQDQTQEVIDQAERQAASARWTLDNIWRVEEAGLSRNSPNYPGTPQANDRHKTARNDTWVSDRELHEWITQPVQVIVPDTERYWSPEAETALVYPIGDHEYHNPMMCMVHSTLEESWDDNPDESIIAWMRLNISPPEEYPESSDLKVYKMFVTGILWWLTLHDLLGVKYTKTQVQFLGMWLKGNASEWFTRNVEHPGQPIRDWSMISLMTKLWCNPISESANVHLFCCNIITMISYLTKL